MHKECSHYVIGHVVVYLLLTLIYSLLEAFKVYKEVVKVVPSFIITTTVAIIEPSDC